MDTITIKQDELQDLGGNVQMGKVGEKIIIVIGEDTALNTPSNTGKSMAIASTAGMMRLSGNLMMNLWYGRKL